MPSIDVPLIRPIAHSTVIFTAVLVIPCQRMLNARDHPCHGRRESPLHREYKTCPPSNPISCACSTNAVSFTRSPIRNGLDAAASKGTVTAYVGYDATATSLHIGNLISATMLYWLQETGHRPIALMGGGTSMIGDPSFRDDQRQLLTPEAIVDQYRWHQEDLRSHPALSATSPTDAIMVNNADWLMKLNYVEFLRDVGRHFSVNRMLTFDSVKLRLDREQSLSFLEFNYMILQAYDFVELNKRYGCRAADGRLGPMGQHRQRHRPRPSHGYAAIICADDAAADDLFRRKDGQVGQAAPSG